MANSKIIDRAMKRVFKELLSLTPKELTNKIKEQYMWTCERCGEHCLDSTEEYTCKKFHIIDEDGERTIVFAHDKESAALKFAKELNTNGDQYLINSHEDILVNGNAFRISAEANISYLANQL